PDSLGELSHQRFVIDDLVSDCAILVACGDNSLPVVTVPDREALASFKLLVFLDPGRHECLDFFKVAGIVLKLNLIASKYCALRVDHKFFSNRLQAFFISRTV